LSSKGVADPPLAEKREAGRDFVKENSTFFITKSFFIPLFQRGK
jgi:hypothetical protein